MRECIFCGGREKINREHVWPEWILKLVEPEKIRGFIGHNTNLEIHRELKIRSVCKTCNEGWMSELETASIPLIGPLIEDKSKFIGIPQRRSIAVWSIKTSMMMDSTTASASPLFYTREERYNLKTSSAIPPRTNVWLGRFIGDRDIGASMSQIKTKLPDTVSFPAQITSFVLGCLVIQVATVHLAPEYDKRTIVIDSAKGPWTELIVPCWPTDTTNIYWPPVLAFNYSDTVLDFNRFADRFNLGVNVPITPKNTTG